MVDLGCLGTALVEVLGGEVDLEVDGFEVTLEPEFTWVLVKVKGLGGAGALREPMDSNSSFPVILTPSIVLATVETLRHMLDFRFSETTLRFTHIYMEVSNRLLRNMVRYPAFVVHYIEFVLMAALRN